MVEVYRLSDAFPKHELYGLTSQSRRAAGSVIAHIAEAAGRLSFGEKRQLLSQGRGSLFELKAHLIASRELGYLFPDQYDAIHTRAATVARLLSGYIRYIKSREAQSKSPKSVSPNPQPPYALT